mmetsp:Transcript_33314/g.110170  ORF Transcript_33314/g.110170 Transcript_33314/m.110170 type:complete len:214 (-) Transcript_33314:206-847(-)
MRVPRAARGEVVLVRVHRLHQLAQGRRGGPSLRARELELHPAQLLAHARLAPLGRRSHDPRDDRVHPDASVVAEPPPRRVGAPELLGRRVEQRVGERVRLDVGSEPARKRLAHGGLARERGARRAGSPLRAPGEVLRARHPLGEPRLVALQSARPHLLGELQALVLPRRRPLQRVRTRVGGNGGGVPWERAAAGERVAHRPPLADGYAARHRH